jgi:hypothetical protein
MSDETITDSPRFAHVVNAMLRVLSLRAAQWTALVMAYSLSLIATLAVEPAWLKIVSAGAFTALVFLPLVIRQPKGGV